MSNLNMVQLIGRLGQDPELKNLPSGNSVVNLRIATSETWKDKESGDRKEKTEWHSVTIYGRTAEVAQQYTEKGSLVYIQGRLQTRKWQDKNGADRYTTEIVCENFRMLSRKQGDEGGGEQRQQRSQAQGRQPAAGNTDAPGSVRDEFDDDIPFGFIIAPLFGLLAAAAHCVTYVS